MARAGAATPKALATALFSGTEGLSEGTPVAVSLGGLVPVVVIVQGQSVMVKVVASVTV